MLSHVFSLLMLFLFLPWASSWSFSSLCVSCRAAFDFDKKEKRKNSENSIVHSSTCSCVKPLRDVAATQNVKLFVSTIKQKLKKTVLAVETIGQIRMTLTLFKQCTVFYVWMNAFVFILRALIVSVHMSSVAWAFWQYTVDMQIYHPLSVFWLCFPTP